MYIPEFWVGVIATILAEVATVLCLVAWANWKDNRRKDDWK